MSQITFYRNLRLKIHAIAVMLILAMTVFSPSLVHAAGVSDASCQASRGYKFLGILPVWYEYVKDYKMVPTTASQLDDGSCGIVHNTCQDNTTIPLNIKQDEFCGGHGGVVSTSSSLKSDIIAISLAVLDILLRVGALVAVGVIMLGGFKYMSSQGEPKNLEAAMATLVNAAIGLGIVITATVLVAFIGHTLGG